MPEPRLLAIVTGASSGIGLELAKLCIEHGYDLVIAADQPTVARKADELRAQGAAVEAVEADLATTRGWTSSWPRCAAARWRRFWPTPAMARATPSLTRTSRTCGT